MRPWSWISTGRPCGASPMVGAGSAQEPWLGTTAPMGSNWGYGGKGIAEV